MKQNISSKEKKSILKIQYPHLFTFSLGYIYDWEYEEALESISNLIKNKYFVIADIDDILKELANILEKKDDKDLIINIATFMLGQGNGIYEKSIKFIEELNVLLKEYKEASKSV